MDFLHDQLVRLDLRNIKNVVDNLKKKLTVSLNRTNGLHAMGWRLVDSLFVQQNLCKAKNGRHRRTNFVAHIGEKLALGSICRVRARPEMHLLVKQQVGPYNISFDKSLLDVWTSSSSVYPLYVTNPLGDVNYALYPIWIIGESGIMFIGIFDYVEPGDTDLARAHFDIASQLWKLGYDEVGWVLPQVDGAPGIAVTGIDKNNELGFGAAYWKDEDTYVKILGRFFKEGAAGDVYKFLETIHVEELIDEP